MNERDELKQELQQELKWVKYRLQMLDLIQHKLLEMKEIGESVKQGNISSEELKILNAKFNSLDMQVKALDGESRTTEEGKILE